MTIKHDERQEEMEVQGYDQTIGRNQSELTEVRVESAVTDQSEAAHDATPVEARRAWERLAEEGKDGNTIHDGRFKQKSPSFGSRQFR